MVRTFLRNLSAVGAIVLFSAAGMAQELTSSERPQQNPITQVASLHPYAPANLAMNGNVLPTRPGQSLDLILTGQTALNRFLQEGAAPRASFECIPLQKIVDACNARPGWYYDYDICSCQPI